MLMDFFMYIFRLRMRRELNGLCIFSCILPRDPVLSTTLTVPHRGAQVRRAHAVPRGDGPVAPPLAQQRRDAPQHQQIETRTIHRTTQRR